ncbi:MAG: right-handed parallel beta-helix repeat-containing protein [Nitrospira sp.]|nr:right-handed parallel beta-helix repeat-containing protein [Nitrospira sp.]
MERPFEPGSSGARNEPLQEPPPNPKGGRTLIVDARDPHAYLRPSAALKDAGEHDQIFIRPGVYEDKVFVADQPVRLIGAGRDHVQIYSRRGGPLYVQRVPSGLVTGITFRYVGSDQHSAMNLLDSSCIVTQCRATEGVLSGVVMYGPEARAIFIDNEVCYNRESGIFVFAGAQPRVADNQCFGNHHFGLAVRDPGSHPECVRNLCHANMLSGILLFHHAEALLLDNTCRDNQHWGLVMTPDTHPTPSREELVEANVFQPNPRGSLVVTEQPLADIGR